jgi:hypothetical protein
MDYKHLLISLADQLDREGKFEQADQVDENFEEFLKLLEEGDSVNVEVDWMSKLIVQTVDRIMKGKYEPTLA